MASLSNGYYNYLFREIADKRVDSWFLMSDPFPLFGMIAVYLYFVLKAGPAYMKNRPAYDLKTIIQLYNVGLLLGCIYVVHGYLTNGWLDEIKIFTCHPVDYSMKKRAVNMLTLCYIVFLMKIVEFLETIFFVLRKKQNQVSVLHVYHHASTSFLAWMLTKYAAGGLVSFLFLINNMVHVLMYTYYLLSTFGPQWQKRLSPFKPVLTIIQMIQFCFMLVQCAVGLLPGCNKAFFYVILTTTPNVMINFYMFANFFRKSYLNKKNKHT